MSRKFWVFVAAHAALSMCSVLHAAPISVTFQAYTPGALGTAGAGLNTTAYKATNDGKFQDFPLNTGGGTNKFARGLSNNSFAASTILPIGPGGGLTLKFQQPVNALPDAKEFVIHNGNFLSSTGGFFYGDMEGTILVSNDNTEWRTLTGDVVADPLTYAGTTYDMNAPTMSYVWGTGKVSWDYCTGSGKPQSVLDTFAVADYGAPMPDDSLFNGAGTSADRAALKVSTNPADYANAFGATAGGNWFDISNSGLSQIQYLRINVAANAPAIVRLDSVFANVATTVPEPASIAAIGLGAFLLLGRRGSKSPRRYFVMAAVIAGSLFGTMRGTSAATFNDIQFWVGSGANRAAFVADWNDGKSPESLMWGFRWDGTATGEDMLKAIAGADHRLFATVSTPFGGGLGTALYGLGYDLDNDGFGTSPPLAFTDGSAVVASADDSRTASDVNDHYMEGWLSAGFWSYWSGGTGSMPSWGFSNVGMSSHALTDGSWDGWSFAPGFSSAAPSEPVPATVPEPAGCVLLSTSGLWLAVRRIR